jgi:CHAT domain-containing protein
MGRAGRPLCPLLSSLQLGAQSLTVIDILQMRLRARLACLSGCSTGASTPHEARDAQGLIEALLTAGAGAVVASLWRVSDEAALDWMRSFYEDISDLDAAISRATAETRQKRPHPAAWAPFLLFGAGA